MAVCHIHLHRWSLVSTFYMLIWFYPSGSHKWIGNPWPILVGGIPTPLKNISQLGWFFPIYGKNKCSEPPISDCCLPIQSSICGNSIKFLELYHGSHHTKITMYRHGHNRNQLHPITTISSQSLYGVCPFCYLPWPAIITYTLSYASQNHSQQF